MNHRATSFISRYAILSVLGTASLALASCSEGGPQERGPDGVYTPSAGDAPLKGADLGGSFELIGSDGETVRWSDFEGQYRIIYFGFAYCPDICPTDVQRMIQGLSLVQDQQPELAAKIQPIFVSVDTERDTPEIVGEFASAFSDDLIGLTGSAEQVQAATDKFGIFYSRGEDTPGGGYLIDHSRIVYLFGPAGEPLATLPTDLGPEAVAEEIIKWSN
ncbi:MAG: SCO family protein [Erythrobacter sp.]